MEPGVFYTGRCTMLESGSTGVEFAAEPGRHRDTVRS